MVSGGIDYDVQLESLIKEGFGFALEFPIIEKLAGVSFLGLLDSVYGIEKPSTRLQHTVGVAHLSLKLAKLLELSKHDTFALVISAFLHDVGHAAFSHNSEPFLLETKNVYHTGVLSRFLKSDLKLLVQGSINSGHNLNSEALTNDILGLLSGTSTSYLNSMFHSPLNCDKIEGNARTGHHLGLEGIDPDTVLDIFLKVRDTVYVDTAALNLIDRFWLHEKELYWDRIYTNEVFSAEAMLTRALHLRFGYSGEEIIRMTDEEVMLKLKEDDEANYLVERIEERCNLQPLSEIEPQLFDEIRDQFKQNRFEPKERKELEDLVAVKLGNNSSRIVISHFSRRKHFDGDTKSLRQLDLFGSQKMVELSKVNDVLRRTKISGDFFEVFISA